MKILRLFPALALCASAAWAAGPSPLVLEPGDLRIEQRTDGGYHLYVRARQGIGSVLLTESTKDPSLKAANYAYRAKERNSVNGDERRMLDGKFIPAASRIWSLIDSTPEPDPVLGSAFHVFIPWVVAWGYPWSRSGETYISDGSFINVRAFAKPWADYSGAFADNPYLVRVGQKPAARAPAPPPPAAPAPPEKPDTSRYMPETLRSYEAIAEAGKGELRYAKDEGDIVPQLAAILDKEPGGSLDLVVCLDTTDSMQNDIDAVKAALPGMLKQRLSGYSSCRLGLLVYRDYFEEYLYRRSDFVGDLGAFLAELAPVRVAGGRDIPEAVYEALYAAITEYPWSADRKLVVLIGDAPPHPFPRGKIDKAMVDAASASSGVEMDVIILPHESPNR